MKHLKKILILFVIGLFTKGAYAQVKVGNNPTTINTNAVLELEATNKGLLLPRVALTGTANVAPLNSHVAGMTVYNTSTTGNVTPGFYFNDGTQWVRIADQASFNNIYTSNGTIPAATNRIVTLGANATSKLTIAPTGQAADISVLNIIGGGLNNGISISGNYNDNTAKEGQIRVPQYVNTNPPVAAFVIQNSATRNLLNIGGSTGNQQANPSSIIFRVDGDNDLTNTANTSSLAAMAILGETGNVGIGTTEPKAALDITSTTSGLLLPRYTTAQRTALTLTVDQDGLAVYDTDEDCIFTYKHSTTPTWVSYCKVPFSIFAETNRFTTLGQVGATYKAGSNNVLHPPLTWTVESFSGDISNVTIAADSPTLTATITYNVPTTTSSNGKALVRLKAVDALGQIQFTTTNITTSSVVSETSLACNGDLQLNNPTLVGTKFNLFAKTSMADAYLTYIAPSNTGNVNVTVTGDTVRALVDPGTGNALRTWLAATSGGTGFVTANPPVFMTSNPDFNNNPTLNFTAANQNALGIVTGNGSGAFKLVFLAKVNSGAQNATILSAGSTSNLGSAGSADNGSWQVSRRGNENLFIFRSRDAFVSKITQAVTCSSCSGSEVAFSTWSDFADGAPHLVVVDYDGTTIKGYFDGAFVFEINPNATHAPTGNQFRIGINRGGNSFIDMELSELIIGNSSMTTAELITVQGYFLCKYGLDASLLAYASPFSITNSFYNNPSQFSLQIDGLGEEKVYDKINNLYYEKTNVPTPGLGYFTSPQISAIQADYIVNIAPGPGTNQITCTRGNGTSFVVTVP